MKKTGLILFFVMVAINLEAKLPHPKYLQELAAGYAFGTIGWCVGATSAHAIWSTEEDALVIGRYTLWNGENAPSVWGYSLYGLGASIGVWITGKQYDDGEYISTLVGTILFPLVLAGVKKAMAIELKEVDEVISFSLPLGAFIGYNLSRSKK